MSFENPISENNRDNDPMVEPEVFELDQAPIINEEAPSDIRLTPEASRELGDMARAIREKGLDD
ncbi:MAG: hypothetical protein JWP09_338 [Candidatus Taylorbacteria bacterium]|nr:hypothetical protein [Candidatus Taylorbacteria bacterium]